MTEPTNAQLAARMIARADEIDNRLGPLPGHVADAIAKELRLAAQRLEAAKAPPPSCHCPSCGCIHEPGCTASAAAKALQEG